MRSDDDCIKFGMLALEKGYITEGQLGRAVSQQMEEDLRDMPHRRLGEILLAMEFINETEIESILGD